MQNVLINHNDSSSPYGTEIESLSGTIRVPQFIDLSEFGYDIAVAKYPITNCLFDSFLQEKQTKKIKIPYSHDERFNQPTQPVVGIKEKDVANYCEWLSQILGLSVVKLPDVSEWESIARCNTDNLYSSKDGSCSNLYVNIGLTYGETNPVDYFPVNKWGLHDMSGNVLEWTDTAPDFNEVANELGAISVQTNKDLEKLRILKGGCWSFDEFNSTISANIVLDRLSEYYIVGFRPIIKL